MEAGSISKISASKISEEGNASNVTLAFCPTEILIMSDSGMLDSKIDLPSSAIVKIAELAIAISPASIFFLIIIPSIGE